MNRVVNMDSLSYREAVKKMAHLEKYANTDSKLNAFDRSLILAVLFGKSKQETLDDMVKLRS